MDGGAGETGGDRLTGGGDRLAPRGRQGGRQVSTLRLDAVSEVRLERKRKPVTSIESTKSQSVSQSVSLSVC